MQPSQRSISYMDTKYVFGNGPDNSPTALVLGPNYIASRFYHHSPPELRYLLLHFSGKTQGTST